jgi:hypothetical protein
VKLYNNKIHSLYYSANTIGVFIKQSSLRGWSVYHGWDLTQVANVSLFQKAEEKMTCWRFILCVCVWGGDNIKICHVYDVKMLIGFIWLM